MSFSVKTECVVLPDKLAVRSFIRFGYNIVSFISIYQLAQVSSRVLNADIFPPYSKCSMTLLAITLSLIIRFASHENILQQSYALNGLTRSILTLKCFLLKKLYNQLPTGFQAL